ncbi:MAG: terminase large subunit domain-containing protein [Patescibacteria group bacterium]
MELVKQALLRVGVYWHIFPTYSDAKDTVWRDPNMLFRIIPESLITRTNETELVVYLKNGSIIQLKGSDDPDLLRGPNPFGVIFDEFAKIKLEAWGVVEPVIRANNGWAWFVGTPKGKNHLHQFYLRGQEGLKEWKSWLLKASQSGLIEKEQLEESRRTSISQAFFNQEWECEFLEGIGSVFRGVREIADAVPHKPLDGHYYVMGVDLAKVNDYTVIAVYDRTTNKQVYQDRFNTIEWPFQKKRIKVISDHYNKGLVILDATGVGDPIYDDLIRAGVPCEAYKFSEQSKKELIEKLSIWIEQKRISILPIQETLFEFDNFNYEIGPTGRLRYGAPEGFNDDIVIAHTLAVWSLQPLGKEVYEKPKSKIQKAKERAFRSYEDRFGGEFGGEFREWERI